MFDNSARPTAANYRARARMIVEAASSGETIAQAAGHRKMVSEFRNARLWGESLLKLVESGKR